MSRTILLSTLVIACATAAMPLLVRPAPVGPGAMERAVAEATIRVKDPSTTQMPLPGTVALAAVR